MSKVYVPRNDLVLLQLEQITHTESGIAVPNISEESHKWTVVAIGPKVEDLKVGDEIFINGDIGREVARLPGREKLYITKEMFVILKVQRNNVQSVVDIEGNQEDVPE